MLKPLENSNRAAASMMPTSFVEPLYSVLNISLMFFVTEPFT